MLDGASFWAFWSALRLRAQGTGPLAIPQMNHHRGQRMKSVLDLAVIRIA